FPTRRSSDLTAVPCSDLFAAQSFDYTLHSCSFLCSYVSGRTELQTDRNGACRYCSDIYHSSGDRSSAESAVPERLPADKNPCLAGAGRICRQRLISAAELGYGNRIRAAVGKGI